VGFEPPRPLGIRKLFIPRSERTDRIARNAEAGYVAGTRHVHGACSFRPARPSELLRKIFLLLLFLSWGIPAFGQVSVVQHTSARNSASSASVSATFVSNATTSNYVLVSCAWFANGETVTVTDNASGGSNSYADTGSGAITNSTGPEWVQTFKAKIVHGGGTKPTASCNFSPNTSFVNISIAEISGADSSTFVDSFNSNSPNPASGTNFQAGTVATSAAVVLVYAACVPQHDIKFPTRAYTQLEKTSDSLLTAVASTNTTVSGSYGPQMQQASGGNDNVACSLVGIKAANQSVTGVSIGNSWSPGGHTTGTSFSWTHTSTGASNGLLIVALDYEAAQSGNPTVTFNSVSMSRATALHCYNSGSGGTIHCVDVYQLLAPASGAHTVSVTYANSTAGMEMSWDFGNVNQTTPIASVQTDLTAASTSSVTVTSTTGDWVLSNESANSSMTAICPLNATNSFSTYNSDSSHFFASGFAAGAGSVVMNWQTSSTGSCPGTAVGTNHAHVAFDIQQSAAATKVLHKVRME
jgi:hypothetical protein